MLSRIVTLAAIALCAAPVGASPKVNMDCVEDIGAPGNCVPMVGCVGREGDYFTGRAIGWNKGTLDGQTRSGAMCSGGWEINEFTGQGHAAFECDNGTAGVATMTYQDMQTGTATGRGYTTDGDLLEIWSGHNIRRFLKDRDGSVEGNLTCGDVVVPVS
ncbi:hypothetical protein So717_10050 [Roseobacter cerasinus]|uniref:Uncharacterized protein n=1 Tax=Roseobacter cerasinus TaxID=2602289 RepID=A0A640VNK9_9RHOB|nr:hypothetical protein [Roseobacter cerasinus]GFE49252.1 hypothetical protein So717_10050 [Roseobacter cerasinus]